MRKSSEELLNEKMAEIRIKLGEVKFNKYMAEQSELDFWFDSNVNSLNTEMSSWLYQREFDKVASEYRNKLNKLYLKYGLIEKE